MTGLGDLEATTSSSVATDTTVTTDDGETALASKKAKSGPVASLLQVCHGLTENS